MYFTHKFMLGLQANTLFIAVDTYGIFPYRMKNKHNVCIYNTINSHMLSI